MPRSIQYTLLSDAAAEKLLGKAKRFSADYPKKALDRSQISAKLKAWRQDQVVKPVATKLSKITAVKLNKNVVSSLRAIHESPTPTAESIKGQKMNPDDVLGSLYSSFAALEFSKMQSELKLRMSKAKTPAAKAKVNEEWGEVVRSAQTAFAGAGLRGLKESDLATQAQELGASKANFTAITNIYNTGKAELSEDLKAGFTALGGWVTQIGKLDPGGVSTVIPDLCSKPFAEGSFTKHFGHSFNLNVTLTVWCPTWTHPFRTCRKTFTLAGVSFSFDISVGYRVTCCGAVAWGQAHAEACGTLLGVTVCAGCTGTITGVAGIGRSGSGNNCTYGIGINAQLRCTFAGITVFQAQAPFGYNVSGPCPPLGLCG